MHDVPPTLEEPVARAERLAQELGHHSLSPIHIAIDLVRNERGVRRLVDRCGVDRTELIESLEWRAPLYDVLYRPQRIDEITDAALSACVSIAANCGDSEPGPEHLFLAVFDGGSLDDLLGRHNLEYRDLVDALRAIRRTDRIPPDLE